MAVSRHRLPILVLACMAMAGCDNDGGPVKTGVLVDELGLERHVFIEDERLKIMTDLHVDRRKGTGDPAVWFAARNGTLVTDRKGTIIDSITYHHPLPRDRIFNTHIVDVDSDSEMEIYRYLAALPGSFYLLDRHGEIRWQADVIHGDRFAFGDLTGDGVDELILSSLKNIQVFDEKRGKIMTLEIPDQVFSMATFDVDDSPGEELFAFVNGREFLQIVVDLEDEQVIFGTDLSRNSVVRGEDTDFMAYFNKSNFGLCTKAECLLLWFGGEYKLYDPYRNEIMANFPGPYITDFRGVEIRFSEDSEPYFAVAGKLFGDMNRHEIYVRFLIFNSKGELVYEEVFEGRAEGIAALPRGDGGEDLLVGGDGFAVRYTLPATRKAE